jgi:hypothetical protein
MSQLYSQSKKLFYAKIRVLKDDAYFVYFTLEANEGLCYYSTTDESLKSTFRDIEVKCPIEAKENVKLLFLRLQTELRLDVLEEEIILDS